MLANDLTLNPGSYGGTAADKIYNLVSLDNSAGVGTLRRVASTATTAPETLKISHFTQKKGEVEYDQHMVRVDETQTDAVKGVVTASVWTVIRVPKGTTAITVSKVKDLLGRNIACLMAAGATDKVLNGES